MKLSSSLRIIPVVFAVIATIAMSVVIISVSNERELYNNYNEMKKYGQSLQEASDFLTEQARNYVQYGEKYYLEAYYRETHIKKTREKVLQFLMETGADEKEISLVNEAADLSFELEKLETRAFDMVADGNLEEARLLLFSEEYIMGKQPINEKIASFQKLIEENCILKINSAKNTANVAFVFMTVSLTLIVVTVFVFYAVFNGKLKGIREMAQTAENVADGYFNSIDFSKYSSNDEFGLLAKGLERIINTVYKIKDEISDLSKGTNTGNMFNRTIQNNLKGGWSQILNELNEAVKTVREQIIENAPLAYIAIKEGIILDCNRYAYEQIGMKPGEYIESYYKDPAERKEILKKLKLQGYLKREKITFKVRNREYHRFSFFMNTIRNGDEITLIMWGMDIEDEEEKNDIVLRNKEDVQKIVDALPMAMIIENPVTKDVYYGNTAFFALMGYISIPDIFEINEKNFFNFEQADNQSANEREAGFMKLLEDGETAVMEFTYKSIRGKRIDARVSASEIVYGSKKCVLKIIQDIGEEKLRTQFLQDAADHEREANRLKSAFLANMSHEIRTPMNAIIGFTQIALMREQEPQNIDVFKKISLSAKNLLTIINDILDFSKIEARKIDLVESEFALEDIVANAFMIAADRIEDKKVEMLLDIAPETPLNLYGDKTRLWQILKNLLDNSAKYTEYGFVILKIYPERLINGKLNIIFRVEDSGIGMTKEQVSALFVPFNQFSDNYKYKSSGTGLGMSIIKQLLDLIGGTIDIDSVIEKGTKITVSIPFTETEDKTTLSGIVSKNVPEKFNILIADDDPISCEIMQRIVETAGFSATYVHTGADVINEVKKKNDKGDFFNIIILDYILGEDNGLDIGRELLKYNTESKLLMVSAYVKQIPGIEIREIGFEDVLQKPLIPSMFIKRLFDAIGSREVFVNNYTKFDGVNILLCEDNPLNREIAIEMLKIMGIEPDVAGDGFECLTKLDENKYDLILMDILMPNMDGIETTRKIRESNKPYKDICIIAMTANVMTEQIEEFMKVGMNGHIPKPIEFSILQSNLEKHLPDSIQKSTADIIPKDNAEAGFSINGIAVGEGLARFGGNEDRYKNALLRFANDKETYHNDEGKDFARYIHTLKGVAANLGIMKLSELARQVESEFKSDNPYNGLYNELKEELREISKNIRDVIKENEIKSTPSEFGKKDEYYKLLDELKEALKNGNAGESEIKVKKLAHTKWIGVSRRDYNPIEEAVNNYEFDKAFDMIEELHKN